MGNSHKNLLFRNHWVNSNQTLVECWDWLSSFRGEHFFKTSLPLFPIFSLAAILVENRDHRTQLWKGAMQRSSIITKFWWNSHWMVLFQKWVQRFGPSTKMAPTAELSIGITGHNFGRGPCKDHSTKVWLQLAQWFLWTRLNIFPWWLWLFKRLAYSKFYKA
jgi:hypothetical protein